MAAAGPQELLICKASCEHNQSCYVWLHEVSVTLRRGTAAKPRRRHLLLLLTKVRPLLLQLLGLLRVQPRRPPHLVYPRHEDRAYACAHCPRGISEPLRSETYQSSRTVGHAHDENNMRVLPSVTTLSSKGEASTHQLERRGNSTTRCKACDCCCHSE